MTVVWQVGLVSWDLFWHCFVRLAGSIRRLPKILLSGGYELFPFLKAFANSFMVID
jgi:hypothetical protein